MKIKLVSLAIAGVLTTPSVSAIEVFGVLRPSPRN